jgi:peptide chain release factor 1
MLERLESLAARYRELELLISDPDVMKDAKRYRELLQEHAHLREIVEEFANLKSAQQQLADSQELAAAEKDHELREMARQEVRELEARIEQLEQRLKRLLVPKDPLDTKNIIMEIRAGTGGEEAALFAADLYRMYTRFAETRGWKIEIISANQTEIGGFKEIIYSIAGKNVYENLRYESGGHRVQRVPETESGGRIHTSAVTVAVLPEAEETEIQISPEELRVDVFRSSGPGGQSVNTTDSAVRITHLPTGMVVTCQDEKSQHKNKAKAMRVLRARLLEQEEAKRQQERAEARRTQIGSGDRSERVRTYNFPQSRVTDHRINLTLYKLDSVMQGALEDVIEPLKMSAREESIKAEAR